MGGLYSKATESENSFYTEVAVQLKDRLDTLETVAEALVQSTASQTSTLKYLLEEEDRKAAIAETSSRDATGPPPQAVSQPAPGASTPANVSGAHSSDPDLTWNTPRSQSSSKTNKPGSAQGSRTRGGKKKTNTNLEHENTSDSIDTKHRTGSRTGRSFVPTPPQDDSGQAMEIEEGGCDSVGGSKPTPAIAPVHTEPPDQRINRNLLETLKTNQASTHAASISILQAVNGLQTLIPKEISEQHQSRARPRPDNATYQIKLYENATHKPVTSVTCREMETQTQVDGQDLLNMVKSFNLAKKEVENLKNLKLSHEREIERLKQDLDIARGSYRQTSAAPNHQSRFWSSKPPPPPRNKANVQIYCHRRSEKINAVNAELESLLQTQFDTINTDLTCTSCEEKGQLDKNMPIIVLCINASRLGTDVGSSLEGLSWNNKIVVVILHHKDTHALPRQPSSRLLTGTEYKSLGGLIDMAFLSNKGIYACDMNQTALSSLMNFITGGRID